MIKTTNELTMIAQTGTFSFGCIRPMNFERTRASSLAKDQVNREAVCWQAFKDNTTATRSRIIKIVAAALERVAWYQISYIGALKGDS